MSERSLPRSAGLSRRGMRDVLRVLYWAWPLFAFLLPLVFALQYGFVRFQVSRATDEELKQWAFQIRSELRFTDHWEMRAFRRAFLEVSDWTIVSREGTVIDIEGFLPGSIGPGQNPSSAIYEHPVSFRSDLGELWRLLAHKVKGGSVLLGILETEDPGSADVRLEETMARFGSTVEEARHVPTRDIDYFVQTAIISDTGEILNAWGGVPLRTPPISESDCGPRFESRELQGRKYRLFRFPILSDAKRPVGLVVLHKDTTGQDATLRQHLLASTALALFAAAGSLVIIFRRVRSLRRPRLATQEAVAQGEGETIEFKSTFQWDVVKSCRANSLRKEVTCTVAAFLNSRRGGQLFIGVADDGSISGLQADLALEGSSGDKLELTVRNTLADAIGRSFAEMWQISFETLGGETVMIIDVEPSREPAFVRGDRGTDFYIRAGNSSRLLDSRDTHSYLRKHRWSIG